MAAVVRLVRTSAFRRGVVGSSRVWFAVWAALGAARLARRFAGRGAEVVERVELRSGEGLVITDTGATRKDLRRAGR